jgi:hypothetical protein
MPPMTHRTNPADDYASYIIRLWRESSAEPDSPWQARIESIQTGQTWYVANPDELLAFLENACTAPSSKAD